MLKDENLTDCRRVTGRVLNNTVSEVLFTLCHKLQICNVYKLVWAFSLMHTGFWPGMVTNG